MTNGVGTMLSRLFGRRRPDVSSKALLRGDLQAGPVYAVGDVHGCLNLYLEIERTIMADVRRIGQPAQIVLLGDMVDRGTDTAGLLDHLTAKPPAGITRHCLMGNHEDLMRRFLESPKSAKEWLEFGGFETLMSYGLRLYPDDLKTLSERRIHQMLSAHIPDLHRQLLKDLPAGMVFDPYILVHAGLDARKTFEEQPVETLTWGPLPDQAPAGKFLVHGHIIVTKPQILSGRISVDTGAYQTGRLSAVRLMANAAPAFLTTRSRG